MLKTLSGIKIIYTIILLDTFIVMFSTNKQKILAQKHSHVALVSYSDGNFFMHIRMYTSTILFQLLNF